MRKRKTDSGKNKRMKLTELTEGAKRELENARNNYEKQILHEAEGCALREDRTEISEHDIQKARKAAYVAPTSGRKWTMRIVIAVVFTTLLSHFAALSQLPNLPFPLLVLLYCQTAVVLALTLLFTYFYRDDLK